MTGYFIFGWSVHFKQAAHSIKKSKSIVVKVFVAFLDVRIVIMQAKGKRTDSNIAKTNFE